MRSATPEEEEAYGLLKDEFKELQMELGRKGSKRGFKDISGWELPPQEQTEEEEEQTEHGERPSQRPRLDHGPHSEDGLPMGQGSQAGLDSSSSSSSSGVSNAGEETAPAAASAPTIPQDVLDRATQSVMRNERLDGTPSQGFNPTRSKLESIRFSPYGGSLWTINEEELEEQTLPDQWIYLEETRSLIRLHHVERRGGFCPQDKKGCPLPVKFLYPKAKVYRQFSDGHQELEEINWRTQRHGEGPRRNWTGFTEFKVKSKVAESKVQEVLAANKGSDEVKESDIKPEEWPLWRVADGEEWSKVEASGAVNRRVTGGGKAAERGRKHRSSASFHRGETLEAGRVARGTTNDEVKVVHTGRQRSGFAFTGPLLSNSHHCSHLHSSPNRMLTALQNSSGRSQKCLHAVGEIGPTKGPIVLQAAQGRTSWDEPIPDH